ncbi:hypothetical protein V8E51_018593 [Hyaloscypha variabilis]
MALSTEAIIAILAIIVNLPPTGLVIWKLFRGLKKTRQDSSKANSIVPEISARSTSITIVLQPPS